MESYTLNHTKRLVLRAMFVAIIILQSWVPFLGFINIGVIAVTIIPVTVILATLLLGTKEGAIIGFTFGLNSFLRALLIGNPIERLIFTSPLVSILPRLLMPIIVGLIFVNNDRIKSINLKGALAGFTGCILNTILVLSAIGFFKPTEYITAIEGAQIHDIWGILWGIVIANGIPEAIFATIVTPILYRTLRLVLKNQGK